MLARPWLDSAALLGLRRWYLPLSRLWAMANAAGDDHRQFRSELGDGAAAAWSDDRLQSILARHHACRVQAEMARRTWEEAAFEPTSTVDVAGLDRSRRTEATRHLATRTLFQPLLFSGQTSVARWKVDDPADADRAAGDIHAGWQTPTSDMARAVCASRAAVRDGLREYWLRAASPCPSLRARHGSEMLYARVIEPVGGTVNSLVLGSGLGEEFDLLSLAPHGADRLARSGWRVIEPVSPYQGLRAMPGFYGGEPFYALAPLASLDLIKGHALEMAMVIGWAHERFGGKVALAGLSMSSFVAQRVASVCSAWPDETRPEAVMLISHAGRFENVIFDGRLAATLGVEQALTERGWAREALLRLCQAVDPAPRPALSPGRIVSVLGETDQVVPFADGLGLAEQWKLPPDNVFRYHLGHFGMPVQLALDLTPFLRLKQVLDEA